MKKLIMLLVVLIMGIGTASAYKSYTIDRSKLPQESQTFLNTHFPKAKIGMIKIDKPLFRKPEYEVRLNNGQTIEFNKYGKWKEVDCKNKRVPDAIIPKNIMRYVNKNYPDVFITQIEKDSKGYEIELSDGVDVKFDLLGNFKSVDIND